MFRIMVTRLSSTTGRSRKPEISFLSILRLGHPTIYGSSLRQLSDPQDLSNGSAVDANIATLRNYLSPQDVVIDGGTSFFQDTERRCQELAKGGIHFMGVGVSGGEEGTLKGPCIMVAELRKATSKSLQC
jgi:hypothetical protein